MPYRLKSGQLNEQAVRAIADEQILRALSALSQDTVTPECVHECRKVVKRLRSLLKLLEPELGKRQTKKLYRSIGQTGKMLAGARDAHVLEQTIAKLDKRYAKQAVAILAPLKSQLRATPGSSGAGLKPDEIARVEAAFRTEQRKFDNLSIKACGFALVEKGLMETYRAVCRNAKKAFAQPTDENFHELRKAVQWHWRHMALLSRAWPGYFAARIEACRELAECLGDDHDLAMIVAHVGELGTLPPDAKTQITVLARARQRELRTVAGALVERLFAERPKAFTERIKRYWLAKTPLEAPKTGAGRSQGGGDDG